VAPHYLISRDGAVVQYVELERIAYHVGLSERDTAAYEAGLDVWTRRKGDSVIGVPYEGYAEWQARWPGKASPLELPSGAHPNGRSVGIEMLSEAGACTDEQYVALLELLGLISAQLQLVLTRDNLYGHFDANPITRVNSRGGTDPGPYFQWDRVYSALAI
jgi:N-acetyl-anhydromuramyl-L-alanine amidase AmpD